MNKKHTKCKPKTDKVVIPKASNKEFRCNSCGSYECEVLIEQSALHYAGITRNGLRYDGIKRNRVICKCGQVGIQTIYIENSALLT